MTIRITLPGRPATKKNSPRVMPMMSKADVEELVSALKKASTHRESISAIMKHVRLSVQPSEAHEAWFEASIWQRGGIQAAVRQLGFVLPITKPVQVSAVFYRDRDAGDLLGYCQALGDLIQEERWSCQDCGKRYYALHQRCPGCNASIARFRQSRQGLGLIEDDRQIVSWDGSRLAVDKARPRIEMALTILAEPTPPQQGLFEEQQQQEQQEEFAL